MNPNTLEPYSDNDDDDDAGDPFDVSQELDPSDRPQLYGAEAQSVATLPDFPDRQQAPGGLPALEVPSSGLGVNDGEVGLPPLELSNAIASLAEDHQSGDCELPSVAGHDSVLHRTTHLLGSPPFVAPGNTPKAKAAASNGIPLGKIDGSSQMIDAGKNLPTSQLQVNKTDAQIVNGVSIDSKDKIHSEESHDKSHDMSHDGSHDKPGHVSSHISDSTTTTSHQSQMMLNGHQEQSSLPTTTQQQSKNSNGVNSMDHDPS